MIILHIQVPEITDIMAQNYTVIRVYTDTSEAGGFTTLDGTVTLVAGQVKYSYVDADGTSSTWYKVAYYGSTPGESDKSDAMRGGTSDAYCTPDEIKELAEITGTSYDARLLALAERASRLIDRYCNRPDGFVAAASATWRKYRGNGGPYQLIDECVEIETVGVKDSPSDVRFVDWTTPDAYSLAAALTVAASGSLDVGTSGVYSANDVLELDDGTNDVWLTVSADNGDGTYSYTLTAGTAGVAFVSGTTVRSTGDWIAFTGDPEAPDFDSLPYTGIMVDPDGSYSSFTGGSYTSRAGFRPTTTVARGVPTVRVKARWGYAASVPDDIKQAAVAQAAWMFKRGQSGFADATATAELGRLRYLRGLSPDVVALLREGRWVKPAVGRR